MFLKALEIVAGSWPLAVIIAALFLALMLWAIIRRNSLDGKEREFMRLRTELEMKRITEPRIAILPANDQRKV